MTDASNIEDIEAKAADILVAAGGVSRYLVAVAGPPASGKSTLAEQLSTAINTQVGCEVSVVVPMDGFHLDNAVLEQLGLLQRKGAPETFDAEGFVAMVRRLASSSETVAIPMFNRELDAVIQEAATVEPEQRILILEGNYLLLEQQPWCSVQALYDETIFLNPGMAVLEERLIARWLHYGLSKAEAREKAAINDLPNAMWVLRYSTQLF